MPMDRKKEERCETATTLSSLARGTDRAAAGTVRCRVGAVRGGHGPLPPLWGRGGLTSDPVGTAYLTGAASDCADTETLTSRKPLTMHRTDINTAWTELLTALLIQGLIALLLLLPA
jgi:hypothetical protein